MICAYRIVKTKRAATAFDGEGARRAGGRWNSVGTPMVYLAGSIALAAMEVMVHLDDASLLASYSVIPACFPESCVADPGQGRVPALPTNWADIPAPVACAQWGHSWIQSAQSLAVRVPSVVVQQETNYLVNPRHPDFSLLQISAVQSFNFDPRLIQKLTTGTSEP